VTPALHTEAPPRVPGDSLRGKRPHDYGPGRVCTLPGCTTILRRTHKGPVCDPCQDNGRCEQGRGMDRQEREAAVLEYIRPRDGWITSVEMAKALGIPKGTLMGTLGRMVKERTLVSRIPAKGGGYRIPATGGVVASLPKTAPDLIPPAPAPVMPPPEQPADEAPASGPLPPQAGLAPFAGILHELVEGREQDAELRVLTMLDDLDDARRERVLQYAVDRWWLK